MIKAVSIIKASKNKVKIVNSLTNGLKIPSEISKDTDIRLNHVSNLLSELKEIGIVQCLNEEDKKGRLYALTDKGNEVVKYCLLKD